MLNSKLMAQILASVGDGVIAVDLTEKIIYMNAAAEQITGWDSAEANGQQFSTVFILYNLRTKERLDSPVEKVLKTGTATGLQDQAVIITKDGSIKFLSANCAPIEHTENQSTGVAVVFRDITRYKVLERKIASEEKNFRTIFNSAPVGMYIVDGTREIKQVNDSALKLLGGERSQVIGNTFGNAFGCQKRFDDERGCGYNTNCQYCEFQRAVSLAFEGSAVAGIECSKTIVLDGKEVLFWFRVNASPIEVDGEYFVVVALADITDQKQREISITKTRDYYLRIFESFPAIIWRTNIAGETESINENWQTLTGQSVAQALGNGWLERLHPDDKQKCCNLNTIVQNESDLAEGEIRILDRNGQYRWLYCVYKLYYNMAGNAEGYIGMGIDISERRLAEEERKKAKDRAEAANMAKSEFLANMSHEIRTPINGIMGMIELTLLTELNHEQKENLATAKSCARSLLDIINDILDFSKMEAGKLLLQNNNFQPMKLLGEVIKTFSHRIGSKGLGLDYTISSTIPAILLGDSNRLRQVLNNLVDNAVKFTDHGGVVVSVKSSEITNDLVELTFTVRDTGIGIAPEEMGKLFKTFSQVDGSSTRRHGGTGLGLVISKQLVEMMGGKMWVESEKNQGSTFSFTLPFKVGNSIEVRQQQKRRIATPATVMKLLLVEDDAVNRMVLQRMVQEIGHQVDTAANGVKALELWQQKKYDAILMDIQMSEMDGVETTKRIRQAEAATGNHIPILALTAHALEGDRERFLAAGMDEYMTKPVQMEELFEKIELFSPRERQAEIATIRSIQVNDNGEIVYVSAAADPLNGNSSAFSEIEALIAGIDEAAIQDTNLLEGIAHQIKGLANEIGSDELKNVAFKAELAARRGNLSEAIKHVRQVSRLCETYKNAGV
jgi:PAS domain S-box-containing protein